MVPGVQKCELAGSGTHSHFRILEETQPTPYLPILACRTTDKFRLTMTKISKTPASCSSNQSKSNQKNEQKLETN